MRYLPPARISDFSRSPRAAQLAEEWDRRVRGEINRYRHLARFLDPLEAAPGADREVIPWTGFPRIFDSALSIDTAPNPEEKLRRIDRAHRSAEILSRNAYVKFEGDFYNLPADRARGIMLYPEAGGAPVLEEAFSLPERPQDEYLEWHVVRNPDTGRIIRIDFTAEPPEYWETLAEGDGDLAAELYAELLKTDVPKEDLFFRRDVMCPVLERAAAGFQIVGYARLFPNAPDFNAGQYNRWNRWNTELGAVHLTQANNTLFAEINLAARATQRFAVRPDLDAEIDRFTLTACGGYGALNRNSDPTIGLAVNTLALSGARAMVSDPIGLYIGEINLAGFRDPGGRSVASDRILTVQRGTFQDQDGLARVLRFSVHPPAEAQYGLESCTFNGHPLTTGGPIARETTVVIHGIAMPATGPAPATAPCRAKACSLPTRSPAYYVAVRLDPSQPDPPPPCPPSTDPVWEDFPVTLAPEILDMVPSGPPSVTGERVRRWNLS